MTLSIQHTIQEADRCVACGLCLPHCPTYIKTGSEADSPRGRIQLMSAVAKEIIPNNARFKAHMNACLSCRNCETACPNGVRYGTLIDTARSITQQSTPLTRWIYWLTQRPYALRMSSKLLRLAQRAGGLTLLSKLSENLARKIALLPRLTPTQSWQAIYPAINSKRGAVNLFLGCITDAFDAETLRASIYVLTQLGYDVHVPPAQSCCGGIARQQGDSATAEQLTANNADAFENGLPVLTTASGCGAGLKDYTELPIQDISDFLAQCDWSATPLQPLAKHIALHEPCTLRNVMKSAKSVAILLSHIPHIKVSALKGNMQCCGGAGTYMLQQPEMAQALLDDKIKALHADAYEYLVTSNIGCAMQLGAGIRQQNMSIPTLHPVMLIAKQMGFKSDLD